MVAAPIPQNFFHFYPPIFVTSLLVCVIAMGHKMLYGRLLNTIRSGIEANYVVMKFLALIRLQTKRKKVEFPIDGCFQSL